MLVAQDLAWYGRDVGEPGALAPLLRRLDAELAPEGLARVRLLYLYPSEVKDPLVATMLELPTVVPYFDLSLQHAARGLLKQMARWGSGERFLAAIEGIRAQEPDATFRSSFIVGFPGETESDHDTLLGFLDDAQLDWAGFFPFSEEAGTPGVGDHRRPRRPTHCMAERMRECEALQTEITQAARDALVLAEAPLEVLVDVVADGTAVGRTHREAPEIDGVVHVEYDADAPRRRARGARARPRHRVRSVPTSTRGPSHAPAGAGDDQRPAPRLPGSAPTRSGRRPTSITIVRLLFTIPVLMMILDGHPGSESWTTFTGWLVLWVTDWLDGWLARREGTTHWGAFLDPLADKVLVLGGLITLAVRGDFAWVPVAIIGAREVFISIYRAMAARRGDHDAGADARQMEGERAVPRRRARPVPAHRGHGLGRRRRAVGRGRHDGRVGHRPRRQQHPRARAARHPASRGVVTPSLDSRAHALRRARHRNRTAPRADRRHQHVPGSASSSPRPASTPTTTARSATTSAAWRARCAACSRRPTR